MDKPLVQQLREELYQQLIEAPEEIYFQEFGFPVEKEIFLTHFACFAYHFQEKRSESWIHSVNYPLLLFLQERIEAKTGVKPAMVQDGKRWKLWSRNAKLYQYLTSLRTILLRGTASQYATELTTNSKMKELAEFPDRTELCTNHYHALVLACLFLGAGSLADPEKTYGLYLYPADYQGVAPWYLEYLEAIGLEARYSHQGRSVIYWKEGDQIAQFLRLANATQTFLDFEALRSRFSSRSDANRRYNFDKANIERQTNAYLDKLMAVETLEKAGMMETLSPDLQIVARLLKENPGISWEDLGKLLNPPLSKSGVYHRINKMKQLAQSVGPNREKPNNVNQKGE